MPISSHPHDPATNPRADDREREAECLHIGLVNNMPGSALEATERQFRTLLDAAAGGISVRLSLYALPGFPRPAGDTSRSGSVYGDIGNLWNSRLDGLIVTGAEPMAPSLKDEPYWESLKTLLEWAEHHTYSSVWSCLAAHAAVLHLDGIRRRPLGHKLCGVFECARVSDEPLTARLTAGVPDRTCVPHSRWNGLPSDALAACGYQVLTQSEDAGIDAFVKLRKSLLVFFQGHPEYEADSLLLEYRRDVGRFLRREKSAYPLMPEGYFDEDAAAQLGSFRERALSDRTSHRSPDRNDKLLADFPLAPLAAKLKNRWRPAAVSVYRNWLLYLSEQKATQKNREPMGRNRQTEGNLVGPAAQ